MRRRRLFLYLLLVALLIFVGIIIAANVIINKATEGKLYSDVKKIPYNKTGILLGTSKFLSNGAVNPFYSNRIKAAADLIRAGKIKYLVISGDNSRKDYNEPQQMKDDLIKQGIDSTVLYLDYAGFRTFDSMIRLKEIFGQTQVTVISQPFHNERAIYIGSKNGIAAIGYNAQDVGDQAGFKVQLREKFARVKVFIDALTGKQPKFLGEKVQLPE
jgi:SanA protein